MTELSILIPAAGQSLRMHGQDKLMMPIDGIACLRRVAVAALEICDQVIITLRHDFPQRLEALKGLPVETVMIDLPNDGMSASLRLGMSNVSLDADGVMIIPADMPEIDAADIRTMKIAFRTDPLLIYRGATATGKPGHPVIFPRRFFKDLGQIIGDTGAQSVLREHFVDVRLIGLPDAHALVDLDTLQDWSAWLMARSKSHRSKSDT